MHELDEKVKHHLNMLGFLINARTIRMESCLPYFDLSVRIWWRMRLLKHAEAVANG